MKIYKILLLLFILILSSCSSDSDAVTPGGHISFKKDGVEKIFTTIYVSENLQNPDTGYEYTELLVYATDIDNPSEDVFFRMSKGDLNDVVDVFYTIGDVEYGRVENEFTMNIANNGNDKKLEGTFSGKMIPPNSSDEIDITEGEFNIQY